MVLELSLLFSIYGELENSQLLPPPSKMKGKVLN